MLALFTGAFIYAQIQIDKGELKPIKPIKPIEQIKETEPVEPVEEITPVEGVKPNEPVSETVKPPVAEVKKVEEPTTEPKSQIKGEEGVNSSPSHTVQDKLVQYVANYVSHDSARRYVLLALKYGEIYSIEPVWLLAIMETESTFRANVVSSENAIGLMQILPSTAKYLGEYNTAALYDPETSVRLSAKYLNELIHDTGSIRMAIIAYNQGIGNVRRGTYKTWYYGKVKERYDRINATLR